jgi:L-lactate dehydrogenase complex protein LldE
MLRLGGLFSVKMPDLSAAMLRKKIAHIRDCEAPTIVTCDVSCMMHINGGLAREGAFRRVRHIAEVLADASGRRCAMHSEAGNSSATRAGRWLIR